MSDGAVWMKCSACRREIGFLATYQVCSVSTCNRARTRLVFCSVPCWDSHVATLRHREAWAVEERAPSQAAWAAELAAQTTATPSATAAGEPVAGAPVRRTVVGAGPAPVARDASTGPALQPAEAEILIVVSKLKKYIRDRAGMNCSDAVADVLSDHVRAICDEAIRAAGRDDRKTVLDRDVPKVPRDRG
jgi:hypothetical protein